MNSRHLLNCGQQAHLREIVLKDRVHSGQKLAKILITVTMITSVCMDCLGLKEFRLHKLSRF